MSTDPSELAPEDDGDRKTDPPPSLERQLADLQAALGEHNALSILARGASEKCTNLCAQLLQRLAEGDVKFRELDRQQANQDARLERLERTLSLPPLHL